MALDLLNQEPITSIDTPEGMAAEACARWYHTVRASVLRQHPWKFASKRDVLASTADYALPFGYDKAFRLPSDYIRLIGLGDDMTGLLITDAGTLQIRYVFDVTNVSQFDSLFVEMFIIALALRIGPRFTGSEARIKTLQDDLKRITPASFSVDGQDRPPTKIQRSRWVSRRRMNGLRGYGSPLVTFGQTMSSPVRYQIENGFILTGNL